MMWIDHSFSILLVVISLSYITANLNFSPSSFLIWINVVFLFHLALQLYRFRTYRHYSSLCSFFVSFLSTQCIGIPLFYILIVLFGAPVYEKWQETLVLAHFLTLTGFSHGVMEYKSTIIYRYTSFSFYRTNLRDLCILFPSIASLVGAYLGAIPIPLDWDRPWQKWPLTCFYGALYMFGIAQSLLLIRCLGVHLMTKLKKQQ